MIIFIRADLSVLKNKWLKHFRKLVTKNCKKIFSKNIYQSGKVLKTKWNDSKIWKINDFCLPQKGFLCFCQNCFVHFLRNLISKLPGASRQHSDDGAEYQQLILIWIVKCTVFDALCSRRVKRYFSGLVQVRLDGLVD